MADVGVDPLAALVGVDGVRTGGAAAPWAVHGRVPAAIAAPTNAEETAGVLMLASAERWTVEPAGGGTGLDGGRAPGRLDLVVTTERMADIVEYEPDDLTATVEAGLPLEALASTLAEHGQWLALDPPAAPGATVGATVATASTGPLRLGYGTTRRQVLGVEVVTGDGRIVRFGGRVVKNVAGYDLTKALVGSRGTLGIITRVHLRLRPRPHRDVTLALRSPERRVIVDAVRALRRARLDPVALELVSPALARRWLDPDAGWALLVRAHGGEEAVDEFVDRVRTLPNACAAEPLDEARAGAAWTGLARLEANAPLVVRLADRPSALDETLALAAECWTHARLATGGGGDDGTRELDRADARAGDASLAAHAGDGIVRLVVDSAPANRAATAAWCDVLGVARARLARRGGTLILARAPRTLVERVEPYGDVGSAIDLMRRLKREFDPAGILAPGRYVV